MLKLRIIATVSTLLLAYAPDGGTLEKPVVGFCINLQQTPLVMYKRYQPLMDYLTEQTPYQFELVISRSNRDTLQLFKKGTVQVGLFDDTAFLESSERLRAVPVLKPLNSRGQTHVRSVIVVSGRSPIRSLRDLTGKKMAFGPPHSALGSLLPHALLARSGVSLDDLASYRHARTQEEVIKAVLAGSSDAGAVAESVAERFLHAGLRIIAASDPFPAPPIVIRTDAPSGLAQSITTTLLALNRHDPAHEERMKQWDTSLRFGFSRARPSEYQQLTRLFRTASGGCGRTCHGKMGA